MTIDPQAKKSEKLIQTAFRKCLSDCHRLKVPISSNIRNEIQVVELKSAYAVTYIEKDGSFRICVSTLLFDEYGLVLVAALKSIIAHELCHTIPNCFNHGKEWKKWVKVLNANGYRINPTPYSTKKTDLY